MPTPTLSSAGNARDPLRPGRRGAVREALLHSIDRDAETTGQIGDVQQGEADSGGFGRVRNGQPHGVRLGVPTAAGRVMQVVELPYRGVSGAEQFEIAGKGQVAQRIRVEPAGQLVHQLAPGPEGAATVVRPAAQRAMEDMGMGVGESRDDQTGQCLHPVAGRRRRTGRWR